MSDDPLKVREAQMTERRPERREDFKEHLSKVPPRGPDPKPRPKAVAGRHPVPPQIMALNRVALSARPPVGAQVATALGSTENLGQARAHMNVEVSRLGEVRQEGHAQVESGMKGRMLELIAKELAAEMPRGPQPPPTGQPQGPLRDDAPRTSAPKDTGAVGEVAGREPERPPEVDQQRELKAKAAVALVERIETFVRSQRPALALTVGGGLDARVEVERTGRNEVALKITGTRGPPSPEDLTRIRDEMQARGLRLSAISVA